MLNKKANINFSEKIVNLKLYFSPVLAEIECNKIIEKEWQIKKNLWIYDTQNVIILNWKYIVIDWYKI